MSPSRMGVQVREVRRFLRRSSMFFFVRRALLSAPDGQQEDIKSIGLPGVWSWTAISLPSAQSSRGICVAWVVMAMPFLTQRIVPEEYLELCHQAYP
eukprot:538565-Pelagomonas_calceolata.AAC.1